MSNIVVCLPNQDLSSVSESLVQLSDNQNISLVLLSQVASDLPKSELFDFSGFLGLDFLQRLAARIKGADYLLLGLKDARLILGQFAEDRLLSVAEDSGAVMVYSDYTEIREGKASARPLIDYQLGSIRDDFAFGALVMLRADLFRKVVIELETEYEFAAFYDVRLKLSRMGAFYRLPEFLYTVDESDLRASGQKLFDYVDPKNRAVQLEMEAAATAHLKTLGAWLSPEFLPVVFDEEAFSVRASVIIPVRNRAKTIGDAVASVLSQLADFEFNCIVVDNHSTDGTSDILADFARRDSRLIHVQPSRTDLGIGGCWNVGVADSRCGMFAVQLDSDDIYSGTDTLQRIVNQFVTDNCAMVVGSYRLVNFDLDEIPPGLIDHKEWTPENGRNNALRINGLGAPRAFYTPVLRELKIPNTSYGEDYAVGLAIARNYQIGRVYDCVYLCRRWDENSDAALDVVKMNGHNFYKDSLRTLEIKARIEKNILARWE